MFTCISGIVPPSYISLESKIKYVKFYIHVWAKIFTVLMNTFLSVCVFSLVIFFTSYGPLYRI